MQAVPALPPGGAPAPPSVCMSDVLFSHLAASLVEKGGQGVYQGSPEWGQDWLHVLVTCWKTAGKHQTSGTPAFQTISVFRMKAGNWTEIKDGFQFRPVFLVSVIRFKIPA
ncbi:unnamed protein product [Tetraodon nigroviridis]|uniref:(spotted green pufferfish) hypothetical protein n=1 Tax=Tetraodon nigroviridis TaxID=99883 RepID=Q4S5D8_TETNG|nr:unnamed protein product [Tetraodon nigroviridis]